MAPGDHIGLPARWYMELVRTIRRVVRLWVLRKVKK